MWSRMWAARMVRSASARWPLNILITFFFFFFLSWSWAANTKTKRLGSSWPWIRKRKRKSCAASISRSCDHEPVNAVRAHDSNKYLTTAWGAEPKARRNDFRPVTLFFLFHTWWMGHNKEIHYLAHIHHEWLKEKRNKFLFHFLGSPDQR